MVVDYWMCCCGCVEVTLSPVILSEAKDLLLSLRDGERIISDGLLTKPSSAPGAYSIRRRPGMAREGKAPWKNGCRRGKGPRWCEKAAWRRAG